MTERPRGSAPTRRWDWILAAGASAILAVAALLAPAADGTMTLGGASLGTCWFRDLAGVPCPFCGLSHSFAALMDGDVAGAFRHHPAGPLLALALASIVIAVVAAAIRRARPITRSRRVNHALELIAVLALVIGCIYPR